MSLPLESYRVKFSQVGKDRISNGPPKPNCRMARWSMIVRAAKSLFSRFSRDSHPAPISLSSLTGIAVDDSSAPFIARESFKRGADIVFFGDELYKWRPDFNVPAAFIALRDINIGEEVMNDPTDLEHSDLMIHWGLTYCPEEQ